jgi:tricorn protease
VAIFGWHPAREEKARRITADAGRELFPKFSPDGKWIAFTAQYDGNFNVYVMPAQGGQPRQLTFYQRAAAPLSDRMGIHNEVVTWFPDSKRIMFSPVAMPRMAGPSALSA